MGNRLGVAKEDQSEPGSSIVMTDPGRVGRYADAAPPTSSFSPPPSGFGVRLAKLPVASATLQSVIREGSPNIYAENVER
jgi:hypothetical protein